MRCASARLASLLIIALCAPAIAFARDYEPIRRGVEAPAPRSHMAKPARGAEAAAQQRPAAKPERAAGQGGGSLFGTVEFGRPLASLPGWLDVLDRNSKNPVFELKKQLIRHKTWAELKEQTASLDTMDMLRKVNEYWNQNPYREDQDNWGKADYWAIPAQFIAKSGDCEDYAIAKYFTLKELGIDPKSMRIVVLRDTIRNLAHAVLAVKLNDDFLILDNVTNIILSHKRIRNYQPQFSVNESGRWMHIKGKPAK